MSESNGATSKEIIRVMEWYHALISADRNANHIAEIDLRAKNEPSPETRAGLLSAKISELRRLGHYLDAQALMLDNMGIFGDAALSWLRLSELNLFFLDDPEKAAIYAKNALKEALKTRSSFVDEILETLIRAYVKSGNFVDAIEYLNVLATRIKDGSAEGFNVDRGILNTFPKGMLDDTLINVLLMK